MTAEDWERVNIIASQVLKTRSKGVFIDNFEGKVNDLTIAYFERARHTVIKSIFNWMYSAANRVLYADRYDYMFTEEEENTLVAPKANTLPFPFNASRLSYSTPIGHLYLVTVDNTSDVSRVEERLNKLVGVRSIKCSPSLLSPLHSSIPIKSWIDLQLYEAGLTPRRRYLVYSFGICTDEIDVRDFGLYRSDKLIEEVCFD